MSDKDEKRKKAKDALIKLQKLVKNTQKTIDKLENYNDKIQEWNNTIDELRGFLKEFGIELDPEIERKLDEISDIINTFEDSDQIISNLLDEIENAIQDLVNPSNQTDTLDSKKDTTYRTTKPAAISTPKIIAITVVAIIIAGVGAVMLLERDNLIIQEVPTPKSTSLIFPADGQRIYDRTPTLNWEDVSHPIEIIYTVKVFKTDVVYGEDWRTIEKLGITDSEFTIENSLKDGTYIWHIFLRDASWQDGPQSETYTFYVGDPDADKDGIADGQDNCRTNFNPDQKDDDSDGIGNICDDTPYRDSDGDGIYDDVDQCIDEPENYNDFQDKDGCPDMPMMIADTSPKTIVVQPKIIPQFEK